MLYLKSIVHRWMHAYFQRRLLRHCDAIILSGPFEGMRYVHMALNSVLLAKYLGTYEKELHNIIFDLSECEIDELINVGAGEGYYSVGFLYAGIVRRVISFEKDSRAPTLMRQLLRVNSLSEKLVSFQGQCDLADLAGCLNPSKRQLILMDIEGGERLLLENSLSLKQVPILVESHDFIVSGITAQLISRFTATHNVQMLTAEEREPQDNKIWERLSLKYYPAFIKRFLLAENRPPGLCWLWMKPRDTLDLQGCDES